MLDRSKGARSVETESSDQKQVEAKFGDGLPRFQPQPGGFGRRTTPVGATPAMQPNEIDAAPAASGQPQFRKPEQRFVEVSEPGAAISGEPALGDIPTRIADWLMRELKDERGIHCETLLTVIGALAGYAAQQALWEGMVKPGKLAITQAFQVVETSSGATYFFGDALDALLASMEPKHLSIWKIVAGGTLASGGDHLPDIGNLLRHCAATAGTSAFGLPRLPDNHLPSILPRAALERFWPGARLLLALAEPLHWPLHMANAAQKLMQAMKGSIAPDLAVRIVMEAAVPMSRVDPATVPNN
ncbi:hypothetical protein [Dongia deserti]|uniref:hypothetical protein n=1 Tax=Dongia deserti TaxID=2268030 RepID=UPI000E65A2CF|nr:hypothetical protein [Dongia deserti]